MTVTHVISVDHLNSHNTCSYSLCHSREDPSDAGLEKEAFSNAKRSFEDISDNQLENLVVDENHGIIYCYIPKVIQT